MPRKYFTKYFNAAGGGPNYPWVEKSIRFSRKGCTNRPFYHIEVHNVRNKSHQQPIEQVGSYDPMPNQFNEKLVSLNYERIKFWIAEGARVSKPLAILLGLAGFFPIHPRSYMSAWRRRKLAIERSEEVLKAKAGQAAEKL